MKLECEYDEFVTLLELYGHHTKYVDSLKKEIKDLKIELKEASI